MRNNALKFSLVDLLAKHRVKVKFVLVGIWNTIFGYSVFCLLDTLFSHLFATRYVAYMSAMVLGQIIAIINAYISHKYITFKSRVRGRKIIIEFFRFSMTYAVTFCLSLILLPIFAESFHITPKISGAIVILICSVISYLGHSRFSFKLKN
jgi:putative flippase GtrA